MGISILTTSGKTVLTGAAGFFGAIHARQHHPDLQVLILESAKKPLGKVKISGGGRCNVLPSLASPAQFVTASSPNTLKKILLSWPLAEQRAALLDARPFEQRRYPGCNFFRRSRALQQSAECLRYCGGNNGVATARRQ